MVNLNMIDTVGSGIKRMFVSQKKKFFPLPDYDLTKNQVKVSIIGKVVDVDYARKLAQIPDLTLQEIILLDKVAKKKPLSKDEAKGLKISKLIEGRRPNYFISSFIAKGIGKKGEYIKNRGLKDEHYKELIINFITKYNSATKIDIDSLIFDLLPNVLDEKQKKNKIRNLIYSMSKKDKIIQNVGTRKKPKWIKRL